MIGSIPNVFEKNRQTFLFSSFIYFLCKIVKKSFQDDPEKNNEMTFIVNERDREKQNSEEQLNKICFFFNVNQRK